MPDPTVTPEEIEAGVDGLLESMRQYGDPGLFTEQRRKMLTEQVETILRAAAGVRKEKRDG